MEERERLKETEEREDEMRKKQLEELHKASYELQQELIRMHQTLELQRESLRHHHHYHEISR